MNSRLRTYIVWGLSLGAALICAEAVVPGAQQSNNPPAKPAGSTNAAPSEVTIPRSVFNMPRTAQDGRDPFFPRSIRPYGPITPITSTNVEKPVVAIQVDLKLKGVSGSPDHRLAIINNHTFEVGEEAEVVASEGKIRIRCLEIRADGVMVQVG